MDKNVIIKNLQKFLINNPQFNDGYKIVYFLVTARKIIENENEAGSYKILWAYCNWVVHTKLNKESSTEVISLLISPNVFINKSRKEILHNIKKHVRDIFNFNKLKSDLKKFTNDKNLPIDLSIKNWNSFCKLFLKEMQTSEIEFKVNIPVKIQIECENSNRYKYAVYLNNKKIGSEVLKY